LSKMKEVAAIAKAVADKTKAGDPRAEGTTIGPVVNRVQWDKIQALIQKGIEEGATLVAGGPTQGRPPDPRRQYQPARRAERAYRSLRRLQAIGQRPRVGQVRLGRISRGQGDCRHRRCLSPSMDVAGANVAALGLGARLRRRGPGNRSGGMKFTQKYNHKNSGENITVVAGN
jgi:hypothetical protein